jgi:hypothetical protein
VIPNRKVGVIFDQGDFVQPRERFRLLAYKDGEGLLSEAKFFSPDSKESE